MEQLDIVPESHTIYSLSSRRTSTSDLMAAAASVTCFIKEAAPRLRETAGDSGLTDEAVTGLFLILQGVEDTIRLVIAMQE